MRFKDDGPNRLPVWIDFPRVMKDRKVGRQQRHLLEQLDRVLGLDAVTLIDPLANRRPFEPVAGANDAPVQTSRPEKAHIVGVQYAGRLYAGDMPQRADADTCVSQEQIGLFFSNHPQHVFKDFIQRCPFVLVKEIPHAQQSAVVLKTLPCPVPPGFFHVDQAKARVLREAKVRRRVVRVLSRKDNLMASFAQRLCNLHCAAHMRQHPAQGEHYYFHPWPPFLRG